MFLRLDTHLKNSATHKSVSDTDGLTPKQQTSPKQSFLATPTVYFTPDLTLPNYPTSQLP